MTNRVTGATVSDMKDRPLAGISVLVVEDNADNAEMLAETLALHGAFVRTTGSARETIELVASWTPNALLLDIELPFMDGYELVRELRRVPAMATVHILAVTGHTAPSDKERAFAVGFDAHVSKPIDGRALVALIAKLVSKKSRLEDSDSYTIS